LAEKTIEDLKKLQLEADEKPPKPEDGEKETTN